MKTILKVFRILTQKQLRMCTLLIVLMFFGAMLEAVGIGALYPLINIIGNPLCHYFMYILINSLLYSVLLH